MVALSLRSLLFVALLGYSKVFAEEEVVEEPVEFEPEVEDYYLQNEEPAFQVHGEPDAMSLDLLQPVNTHRILKETEGNSPHQIIRYKPMQPFRLASVSWAQAPIFELDPEKPEDAERSIDEVSVFRNCYDTVISVKVGDEVFFYNGKDDAFVQVDAEDCQQYRMDIEKLFTYDITDWEESPCRTVEKVTSYVIEWCHIHPNTCYYADKITAKDQTLWETNDSGEHFGGVSIVTNGNEKLVGLHIVKGEEGRLLYFHAVDDHYKPITDDEMKVIYNEYKQKDEAERAKYESEPQATQETETTEEEVQEETETTTE
uniref:Spherical body protein 4 n=1 Tax=Babesia orientalis TaxID=273649 RepID=A0A346CI66_9APIC|nr:spherical body protein 4 [Babesia orientalis]